MPALVPELVNMASDPAISTADLLRRALVVARRLAVPELVDWLQSELKGYSQDSELPNYRKLIGRVEIAHGEGGRKTIDRARAADLDRLMQAAAEEHVLHSVAVIEGLTQQGDKFLLSTFPHTVHALTQSLGNFSMGRVISPIQYRGILDAVRTGVLEWALDLEGRGIVGEGMTFTPKEKQTVQEQHYHISNVSGSQIQIGSSGSTQTQASTTGADLEALKGLVQALGAVLVDAEGDTADELRAELATLKAQADSPKPKWEIIKATARSIKAVAEGAAGGLIAGLAQPQMATLLALAAA